MLLLLCLTRLRFGSDGEGDPAAAPLLPGNHCPHQGVKLRAGEAWALLFSSHPTAQTGRCDMLTTVLYCMFSTIVEDFVEH